MPCPLATLAQGRLTGPETAGGSVSIGKRIVFSRLFKHLQAPSVFWRDGDLITDRLGGVLVRSACSTP